MDALDSLRDCLSALKRRNHRVAGKLFRNVRHYRSLSRFVHRSYTVIMDGYSIDGGDRLVHDGTGLLYGEDERSETALVLPQTIAAYYATLANFILIFSDEIVRRESVRHSDLKTALSESLEVETVPRVSCRENGSDHHRSLASSDTVSAC